MSNINDIEDDINYTQSLIHSKKEINYYVETGVDKYQILGAFNKYSCKKCSSLDGKIFDYTEIEIGVNYPPFCKKCRCTTVTYFKD